MGTTSAGTTARSTVTIITGTAALALAATGALAAAAPAGSAPAARSATAISAVVHAHGEGGVVSARTTTDVPSFLYLMDASRDERDGQVVNPPGGELYLDGDAFGTVATEVAPTGTCVTSWQGAACTDPVRFEIRYDQRTSERFQGGNDFLVAAWLDTRFCGVSPDACGTYYWTSIPVRAWGGGGDDSLDGGHGDDRLYGQVGSDELYGGPGDDLLDGGPPSFPWLYGDILRGGEGDDVLRSRNGVRDDVYCGPGTDVAHVDQWDRTVGCEQVVVKRMAHLPLVVRGDNLRGRPGDDRLTGTKAPSTLRGLAGDDVLRGRGGSDHLFGGKGADVLVGGKGEDWLRGGPGRDVIRARGGGKDVVDCGPGRDVAHVDRRDVVRGCEVVHR